MLAGLKIWQGSRRIGTRRGAEAEDGDDEGALFNRMQWMSGGAVTQIKDQGEKHRSSFCGK